jgi:hypothetical protein
MMKFLDLSMDLQMNTADSTIENSSHMIKKNTVYKMFIYVDYVYLILLFLTSSDMVKKKKYH